MNTTEHRISSKEAPDWLPTWIREYAERCETLGYRSPLFVEDEIPDAVVWYEDGDYWRIYKGHQNGSLAGWNTKG